MGTLGSPHFPFGQLFSIDLPAGMSNDIAPDAWVVYRRSGNCATAIRRDCSRIKQYADRGRRRAAMMEFDRKLFTYRWLRRYFRIIACGNEIGTCIAIVTRRPRQFRYLGLARGASGGVWSGGHLALATRSDRCGIRSGRGPHFYAQTMLFFLPSGGLTVR